MADPKAFVCGYPIAHSRSPLIHNHWLKSHGLAGSYERVEVTPEDFPAFVSSIRRGAFVGGNVTIPHKEAVFNLIDKRDEAANAIGAVNTLWMENGTLWGGNTDAYGFAANLDAKAQNWADHEVATVLGAGGAARAVIFALKQRGFKSIHVVNRTYGRAQALADHFGQTVSAHKESDIPDLLPISGLLVNTTSLGMKGMPQTEVDMTLLPDHAVVADIVYVPLKTELLRQAAQRNLRTVDGLGMLLHQAVPGFERWFGYRPEVDQRLYELIAHDVEKTT